MFLLHDDSLSALQSVVIWQIAIHNNIVADTNMYKITQPKHKSNQTIGKQELLIGSNKAGTKYFLPFSPSTL